MQVTLKSTNLEAHLFKKILSGIINYGVPVTEVVTDSNTQIISIMSKHRSININLIDIKVFFLIREAARVSAHVPFFGCVAQV